MQASASAKCRIAQTFVNSKKIAVKQEYIIWEDMLNFLSLMTLPILVIYLISQSWELPLFI